MADKASEYAKLRLAAFQAAIDTATKSALEEARVQLGPAHERARVDSVRLGGDRARRERRG